MHPPLVAGATTFPPQFGGAAKGKRLNGQARRLTLPHLEVILEMMKMGQIDIVQENIFDDIMITAREQQNGQE